MKKLLSVITALAILFTTAVIRFPLAPVTAQAATAFTPRTTEPSATDKYWIHKSAGGLNECTPIEGSSCLPNCVGYAWGRAYEILGTRPNLSKMHAYTWYQNNIDNNAYPYGTTPKLGAIACWTGGEYGHVAVVEGITDEHNVTFSESSYGGTRFKYSTYDPYMLSGRSFQGYIYIGEFDGEFGGLSYSSDYGTLRVTGLADKTLTKVDIPPSINGVAVTYIDWGAFQDCVNIKSVVIPDSITSIDNYVFKGCTNLTSVTIPNSVTSIKAYAFYGCSSLTSANIPDSVTDIGESAFEGCSSLTSVNIPKGVATSNGRIIESNVFKGCSNLTSVTIPNGVTRIGYSAFNGCTSLTSVTIPNSVTSIGSYAFCDCKSLTSVTIPNGVTSIGYGAFRGCSSLTSVTIPNGVTSIEELVFDGCSNLTSVTIPNSVTSIGYSAFSGCSSLASVTIPNGVTRIVYYAFSGCSSLTSVTIPESVTEIGYYPYDGGSNDLISVFSGCTSLTEINISDKNKDYCSVNGIVFSRDKTELVCYPAGKPEKSYSIPNGVTSIGNGAFFGCSSITSVTIPNSVTSIGEYAFSGCSSLTSVIIPNSVTSIGKYAFSSSSINNPVHLIIYYSGSISEWNEKNFDIGRSHTVYYNSTGPTGVKINVAVKVADSKVDTTLQSVKVTGNGVNTTLTVKDGMLDVSSLKPGTYTFTFSAKNCAPRAYNNITVSNGTATGLSKVELNLYGDINGDGKLTLGDVLKANAAARNSKPLTGYEKTIADINGDGNITLGDVLKMNAHARNSKLLW